MMISRGGTDWLRRRESTVSERISGLCTEQITIVVFNGNLPFVRSGFDPIGS
jgi:hypothetical protein